LLYTYIYFPKSAEFLKNKNILYKLHFFQFIVFFLINITYIYKKAFLFVLNHRDTNHPKYSTGGVDSGSIFCRNHSKYSELGIFC